MKLFVLLALSLVVVANSHEVIQGFHFHTYFLQKNMDEYRKILKIRDLVHNEITSGVMKDCAMGSLHRDPVGPHPIGMFLTCCNVTSVGNAVSFFMKHRTTSSVLLHALTTSELKDHTERAFWLGQSMPLDVAGMSNDLHEAEYCPPYTGKGQVIDGRRPH